VRIRKALLTVVDENAAGIIGIDGVVLVRSDPLDVATALHIGRATLRKMRQNLGWAIGYNALALPHRRRRLRTGLRPHAPARDHRPEHVRLQRDRRGQRSRPTRASQSRRRPHLPG
jgi:hypothetical protein